MKILYLFHDLMNLYGDSGNIRYLTWTLEEYLHETDVTVDFKTIGDELSFEGYDLIYCGSGTESKRDLALNYLRPYKDAIQKAIDEEKAIFLFTGNSWTMLGKEIQEEGSFTVKDNVHWKEAQIVPLPKTNKALGIFSFTTKETHVKRTVGDAIYDYPEGSCKVVGFINKSGEVFGVEKPLFNVYFGSGNHEKDTYEGIHEKRFYGTYLTGPILVKNPPLTARLLSMLLHKEVAVEALDEEALKGYEITLSELTKRMNEEGPGA